MAALHTYQALLRSALSLLLAGFIWLGGHAQGAVAAAKAPRKPTPRTQPRPTPKKTPKRKTHATPQDKAMLQHLLLLQKIKLLRQLELYQNLTLYQRLAPIKRKPSRPTPRRNTPPK